jgi:hypothetical protein
MRAEVVEHEVQPDLGRVQAADVAAEGKELDTALAVFDVATASSPVATAGG